MNRDKLTNAVRIAGLDQDEAIRDLERIGTGSSSRFSLQKDRLFQATEDVGQHLGGAVVFYRTSRRQPSNQASGVW